MWPGFLLQEIAGCDFSSPFWIPSDLGPDRVSSILT